MVSKDEARARPRPLPCLAVDTTDGAQRNVPFPQSATNKGLKNVHTSLIRLTRFADSALPVDNDDDGAAPGPPTRPAPPPPTLPRRPHAPLPAPPTPPTPPPAKRRRRRRRGGPLPGPLPLLRRRRPGAGPQDAQRHAREGCGGAGHQAGRRGGAREAAAGPRAPPAPPLGDDAQPPRARGVHRGVRVERRGGEQAHDVHALRPGPPEGWRRPRRAALRAVPRGRLPHAADARFRRRARERRGGAAGAPRPVRAAHREPPGPGGAPRGHPEGGVPRVERRAEGAGAGGGRPVGPGEGIACGLRCGTQLLAPVQEHR